MSYLLPPTSRMTDPTEALLLAQAQIAVVQVQLLLAAAAPEKPLSPEEKRFNGIEYDIRQLEKKLNLMALTVERFRDKFDEWQKAKDLEMGWLERQNARVSS